MTSDDAIVNLAQWAQVVLPELTAVYDYVPSAKSDGLPDCVVELIRSGVDMGGSDRFRFWDIQQRAIYFCECALSFMVDNSVAQTAAEQLRGMENRLLMAVMGDPTLGNRVPFASPLVEFDFTGPFVEYEDGTRGREMTMTLAVGDLVESATP